MELICFYTKTFIPYQEIAGYMRQKETCMRETEHGARVCEEIGRMLSDREQIKGEVQSSGIIPRSSDKAVLTEKRVIIFQDGYLSSGVEEIPLSEVSSNGIQSGIIGDCTEIRTDSSTQKICTNLFSGGDARDFSEKVRRERE